MQWCDQNISALQMSEISIMKKWSLVSIQEIYIRSIWDEDVFWWWVFSHKSWVDVVEGLMRIVKDDDVFFLKGVGVVKGVFFID